MAAILVRTRFRSAKNATDAKLENTSLSTGVFQGILMGTAVILGWYSQNKEFLYCGE